MPRIRKSVALRFWTKVDKNGPTHPQLLSSCWIWLGRVHKRYGYGYLDYHAHRHSWEIHCGPIPIGMYVCHRCDNKICVNPDHLFLGTQLDNMRDMRAKNRGYRPQGVTQGLKDRQTTEYTQGEQNGNSKLTGEQVRDIRQRYRRYSYKRSNTRELAREFGVCCNAIRDIVKGKRWHHISTCLE
jgi:hypothetical protein